MLNLTRSLMGGVSSLALAPAGVETGVSADPTTSITLDEPTTGVADKAKFSQNGAIKTEPDSDADDEAGAEDDEGGAADLGDPEGDPDESGGEALEDLGEYSDERHDEFDARYRSEDGSLNEAALTAEFDANKGHLNEGTYAYFEALGFPKAFIQRQEAALTALREKGDNAVIQAAGGQEALNAAVAWGRKSYTPEQKKAFNQVMKTGTPEQRAEAIELLAARHQRATKTSIGRRRTTPLSSATDKASSAGSGSGGFESREAWLKAREEAKGNPRKEAAVSAQLRRSDRRRWKE